MSFPFNAQALVEFNKPDVPLGPFDGKVAAVINDWLITTPNRDIIWLPPWGKRGVRVIQYPHLGAIPRKPDDPNDPLSIMWWDPTEHDFHRSANDLVDGLGQLARDKYERFETCRKELLKKVDEYKAKASSPNYYLRSISKAMSHAGVRLGCVPGSFLEMKFGVTEFQRYFLETLGLLDYLEVYKPRMDGAAASDQPVGMDNRMGAFTSDARVAQEFFDARLPVWYIRETKKVAANPDTAPNVLRLVEVREPAQFLVLADCSPPFPRIFDSYTNVPQKYASMHAFSRTWMVYRDPFSEDLPQNVKNPTDPFYSHKKPSTLSVTIPMSELMVERLPSSTESGANQLRTSSAHAPHDIRVSVGRDRFSDPDTPLLPPAMPEWANALKNVDHSPQHIKRGAPSKIVYALPEPVLFVTPSSDEKKISYLMTWLRCRPAWLWRLESQGNSAVSNQMWRDLLGMNFNKTANNQTEAGKRRQQIQRLLGDGLHERGLSYSSASGREPVIWRERQLIDGVMPPLKTIHEILFELYELSFRYELLALDRRLSRDHDQQRITACFPGSSNGLTIVRFSAEGEGLTARDWRSRLHYTYAFIRIMCNWNVEQFPSVFRLVESRPDMISEGRASEMERAAVCFYTQHFFDNFGRAPIIPHRLLE